MCALRRSPFPNFRLARGIVIAYIECMTPSPSARPLSARIAAAASDHPILRRARAEALHAEMTLLPDSIGTAADWRALGRLLRACEVDLYATKTVADFDRALEFSALSNDAHNKGVLMRVRVERDAIRRGRRVPRIIDAACREVVA